MHHPELISQLRAARRILVFTGAGISTGSGIPDFRGPQGVWTKRQPVYFQDFLRSEDKRIEYWDYKLEAWAHFKDAQPNAAHRAVACLQQTGRVQAVVTQNIDGLHQAGGSAEDSVIELHGTTRWVECLSCNGLFPPQASMRYFEEHRRPPLCECGGLLKSATISFGQPLRQKVLARAYAAAGKCDLVLALGSTLSVYPAAEIPLVAIRSGAPYVIINQGPTDHDALATLRIEGDVTEILPSAVDALGEPVFTNDART